MAKRSGTKKPKAKNTKKNDLRRRLEKDPRVIAALQKEETRQTREAILEKDSVFVEQRMRLQARLEEAYRSNRETLQRFFHRFSLVSPFAQAKIREAIKALDSGDDIDRLLKDYVAFANRFRVAFVLRGDPPSFKLEVSPSPGAKFHAKLVDDHLEPIGESPGPEEAYSDYFEKKDLQIPSRMQEWIDAGVASFFQVDDTAGYSLLKDLEGAAYRDGGVSFIFHNAEQPYLLLLVGEKMKKALLPKLGPAISQFQRKHFGRGHGSRPPKLDRFKMALEMERDEEKSNKEKAIELEEAGHGKQAQNKVYLSRLRGKNKNK
jgi:hypothetical protein